MSEQTEQVTAILEHAKVTAMIHDSVLADSGLSSAEVSRLTDAINKVYLAWQKDFRQTYVAPDDVKKLLADERETAFEDVAGLLTRLKTFYKGSKAEAGVLNRITEDFGKLRTKQE